MKTTFLSALNGLYRGNIVGPAASAFLLRVIGAAIQFFFTFLLARFYGPAGVGIFAISLSIIVVSSTMARWGLDQAVLKFVSSTSHLDNDSAIRGILSYARNFVFLSGVVATIAVLLLSDHLARLFFGSEHMSTVIRIMSMAILPLSLTTLYAEAMRGLKKITLYTLLHGALTPLLSIIVLLSLTQLIQGIIAAALAYLVASLIVMFIALMFWQHSTPRSESDQPLRKLQRREIMSAAHAFSWIAIISVTMSFTETLVLGVFEDDASVGQYAASLRLVLVINFIILGFNSILAPNFASLHQQGKLAEIQKLAVQSILIMLTITSPIILVFMAIPEWILSIFGSEFISASPALRLLTLGQLIIVFFGPVAILLQMTGHERAFRNNVAFSAATTLTTSLVLIPIFGVTGAAASSVIGTLILNLLSFSAVHQKLGINIYPFKSNTLSS